MGAWIVGRLLSTPIAKRGELDGTLLREGSLFRPAQRLADLANGAEMVAEVRDARDQAGELDAADVAG